MGSLIAVAVGAYLVTSLNWAILVLRLLGRGDPRTSASGNPGTSNVYRLAGPFWAGVVLLLDLGRAGLVAWAALRLFPPAHAPLVGLALVLGNRFPVWHRFRGGKGVAGYLGFGAVLHPLAAVLSCVSWVLVWAMGRVHYVGSIAMVAALAGGVVLRCGWGAAPLTATVVTLCLIVLGHARNFRQSDPPRRP